MRYREQHSWNIGVWRTFYYTGLFPALVQVSGTGFHCEKKELRLHQDKVAYNENYAWTISMKLDFPHHLN